MSPKQQRRPLPYFRYLSFFDDCHPHQSIKLGFSHPDPLVPGEDEVGEGEVLDEPGLNLLLHVVPHVEPLHLATDVPHDVPLQFNNKS